MQEKLNELKNLLVEVNDIQGAGAVLYWDQSTYMPPGGSAARARQMSTLSRLAHEKLTDPAIGRLLDDLQPHAESMPPDSDDARLIQVTRRDYERATKVPPALTAEISSHTAETYDLWTIARADNDFARLQPKLEKTLDLSRKLANCFPGYDHIADPLIDFSDYGMRADSIRTLFSKLRKALVPIVEAITAQPPADDSCLHLHYPETAQLDFGEAVIKDFGYDFERGRQDKTYHPYMTKFSLGDVRITTRVSEDDLANALFSTLHEAGHAMYEQGIDMDYEATPLADGTSAGIHESQSRLWENLVGRSRGFWVHYYPKLQQVFPEQLNAVSLETFYRAINNVQRSLIRVDADEVTYNLHVMIRFDLELQLLEGSLSIADLPEAWHARYQADLGLTAPDDRDGVLQDVHWYADLIGGAFQGYTLGNIMSAQLFDSAVQAQPAILAEIEQGKFDTLLTWLRENIYRHGAKFTPDELMHRATGQPLIITPYITYLKTKFGELYSL